MMTDKQFNDAFTAAGGWFFLTQYETIKNWSDSKEALIEHIFSKGFDSKIRGSKTRVSSALRIIENEREEDALIKIRDSERINSQHPEAKAMADKLLNAIKKENQDSTCKEDCIAVPVAYTPGRVTGKIKIRSSYRPRRGFYSR